MGRVPHADEAGMDLLLWRHAEAEDGVDDLARPLTPRGRKQARRIAAWLKSRLPAGTRILVSPATRTVQTAEALDLPFEILDALAPGADAASVARAIGWPDAGGAVLLVGHQPWIGELAARLVTGKPAAWSVKKGALWWLASRHRDGHAETLIQAVVPPDLAG